MKAAARQLIAGGQGELDLGLDAASQAAGGGPLPTTSSRMGYLVDGLEHAYRVLGLEDVAGGDPSWEEPLPGAVDADKAVLDAAAFADANNLWRDGKAKVYVTNHPVGVIGRTGELTHWINVYMTRTGLVHGSPGSAP